MAAGALVSAADIWAHQAGVALGTVLNAAAQGSRELLAAARAQIKDLQELARGLSDAVRDNVVKPFLALIEQLVQNVEIQCFDWKELANEPQKALGGREAEAPTRAQDGLPGQADPARNQALRSEPAARREAAHEPEKPGLRERLQQSTERARTLEQARTEARETGKAKVKTR
jgi:hypothetical protein